MHDPPVALPHYLPVFLLLHGWVSLSLPYPVPGLAGWPDASEPLPDHGGVLLKWEGQFVRSQIKKKFGESERVSEKVKEDEMIQEEDKWLTYLSQTNSKHSPCGGTHGEREGG